jgi:tRNA dimethylallyltransferase
MLKNQLPPAIFLMGPTASGKTALSVQLAKKLGCEIISVDSAQVFRQMNIGTAKPTQLERGGVPHHLLDILDPSETFSTGEFKVRAEKLMAEITAKGKIPLLTGGTMLYFNALFHGLAELPKANPAIRMELEAQAVEKGWGFLHQRLAEIDPDSAARIHPNDPQRIQRALEVYQISGQSITQWHREAKTQQFPYHVVKLVIAPEIRAVLHKNIAYRFNQMLTQGLLDEVKQLYRREDLSTQTPSIRSVGYRQVWQFLEHKYDYQTMVEKAIIATRQLAKRQLTWLRRENNASWFVTEQDKLLETVVDIVIKQLH